MVVKNWLSCFFFFFGAIFIPTFWETLFFFDF